MLDRRLFFPSSYWNGGSARACCTDENDLPSARRDVGDTGILGEWDGRVERVAQKGFPEIELSCQSDFNASEGRS